MNEYTLVGLLGVVVLLMLFFIRLAVAYSMAVVGFVGYWYLTNFKAAVSLLSRDMFDVFSSYSLALVPLFVFMGFIAYYAGVSAKLYDVANKCIGRVRGGLAMATIAACTAFGAICGSTTATAATMGTIGLPEMRRYNYGNRLATGSVAAGGGIGVLMPPSVVLIIYGILTQLSIGKLFIAGIIPAFLIAGLFIVAIVVYCAIYPDQGPRGDAFPIKERFLALFEIWETAIVFLVVMGGMFFGFFTPTKAGAVGSFALLVIAVVQGKLSWRNFKSAVYDTLKTSAMVIMLVAGATIFGHFLALTRIPMEGANLVATLNWPGWAIISLICLIYLVGGCFIDALALITLTIPIFYPIVSGLGYDLIWFGVIIVLITQMGIITPPVGVNVYIVKGLSPDVPMEEIFIGVIPFLIALIVGTAIMIAFPAIATFLPDMIG
ncbi:TRAP-type C4-dicarboxylate transport system, large permease component [Desulforapulum autotrophicum HRM2]|uniref:TRAP-type C4-dicarboxylate transport system, large permease component n=1 Tax=Desulforapulum autotrophicum (strain ATCC 43914 / DSM 3382 / VKM B-1955 / HRM2) TaxID=177437 RepID=C0Q966_DESAH|nr:TRAP transporter large permease [Desulforapulum autotrophicum]ACN16571.1 TRAP-type C4-dicarboxylate transport system, large permease component [Desulforapulum autotrophicum HRM2]